MGEEATLAAIEMAALAEQHRGTARIARSARSGRCHTVTMAATSSDSTAGSCLCGGVRYRVNGALRDVLDCHCVRCRKVTGNFMAASGALRRNIAFDADESLTWFAPADDPNVEYGFCSTCGASLFWRVVDQGTAPAHWSICAGPLDDATGLRTEAIWFSDHAAEHSHLDPGVRRVPSSEL